MRVTEKIIYIWERKDDKLQFLNFMDVSINPEENRFAYITQLFTFIILCSSFRL